MRQGVTTRGQAAKSDGRGVMLPTCEALDNTVYLSKKGRRRWERLEVFHHPIDVPASHEKRQCHVQREQLCKTKHLFGIVFSHAVHVFRYFDHKIDIAKGSRDGHGTGHGWAWRTLLRDVV